MANLDFPQKMEKAKQRIKSPEHMLGSGLLQPSTSTNSGSRKLMAYTQRTHALCMIHSEKEIVGTGFENRFGDESSSIEKVETDCQVIAKISKFSKAPEHHYWLILQDLTSNRLFIKERKAYKNTTESYGWLNNNNKMDSYRVGSMIPEGTIIKKSIAYDDFNNRKDGVNLRTGYWALDGNMEDSVLISDVASDKMVVTLIKPVQIPMNENDIPLNLYGNDDFYKIIPDVGQDIDHNHGILIGLRKEKKEESLFMQSIERLKKPLMSDDKYITHGKVIDIDIYCNNPEGLDSPYCEQLKYYYEESMRVAKEFIAVLTPYVASGFKLDYQLEKQFALSKRIVNKDKFIDKKLFSNIILKIYVLEELKLNVGDKVSNRYGGKGVISAIVPQHMMPQDEVTGEYLDMILNSSTMYNRENPGQLFETSLNHISAEICRFIGTGVLSPKEAIDMVLDFVEIVSPSQHAVLKDWFGRLDEADIRIFLDSLVTDGNILISALPITEAMNIDKLNALYKRFSFIKPRKYKVPMTDSNGQVRYVLTRRPIVAGKQYTFRLKQYAEEKFSATSLSATNVRNENVKSKASRDYRELYSNTPIRAGSMEIDNLNHMGSEYVVTTLMLHSLSPNGRRLVEAFYTGDPYTVDIKLDQDSSNRSVEIVNAYLKTMGLRLKFIKRKKCKAKAVKFNVLNFSPDVKKPAVFFNNEDNFDFVSDFKQRIEYQEKKKKKVLRFDAIKFWDDPQ